MTRKLIAVDWGTSSLRVALLDERGQAIEERSSAQGILTVTSLRSNPVRPELVERSNPVRPELVERSSPVRPELVEGPMHGEFASVLAQACSGWPTDALTLICGMAGSKQGWQEAPYVACPADFHSIAFNLQWIEQGRIAIIPGLRCEHHDMPDVMRGEETQVFGALEALSMDTARLVLPGTHSKRVRAAGGRIESFSTFMTGEFYALLRHQSILARTMPADDSPFDEPAFRLGLEHAFACGNLLHAAFGARTLSLFDKMPSAALPSFLSGIVIGEELRDVSTTEADPVIIVGNDALAQRYTVALQWLGVAVRTVGSRAAWLGISAIARTLD